ncbi:hypothetical protein RB195_002004 [Necator americanus]
MQQLAVFAGQRELVSGYGQKETTLNKIKDDNAKNGDERHCNGRPSRVVNMPGYEDAFKQEELAHHDLHLLGFSNRA